MLGEINAISVLISRYSARLSRSHLQGQFVGLQQVCLEEHSSCKSADSHHMSPILYLPCSRAGGGEIALRGIYVEGLREAGNYLVSLAAVRLMDWLQTLGRDNRVVLMLLPAFVVAGQLNIRRKLRSVSGCRCVRLWEGARR